MPTASTGTNAAKTQKPADRAAAERDAIGEAGEVGGDAGGRGTDGIADPLHRARRRGGKRTLGLGRAADRPMDDRRPTQAETGALQQHTGDDAGKRSRGNGNGETGRAHATRTVPVRISTRPAEIGAAAIAMVAALQARASRARM